MDEDAPIEIPIDGTLDLHTFQPRDVKDVVTDYLEVCAEKGIYRVRIVHGKGIGTLREIVHAQLKKLPSVVSYRLGDETSGGWGATWVTLKRIPRKGS